MKMQTASLRHALNVEQDLKYTTDALDVASCTRAALIDHLFLDQIPRQNQVKRSGVT